MYIFEIRLLIKDDKNFITGNIHVHKINHWKRNKSIQLLYIKLAVTKPNVIDLVNIPGDCMCNSHIGGSGFLGSGSTCLKGQARIWIQSEHPELKSL